MDIYSFVVSDTYLVPIPLFFREEGRSSPKDSLLQTNFIQYLSKESDILFCSITHANLSQIPSNGLGRLIN